MRRSISTLALAAVTLAGLVACDPAPPPVEILLTSTAAGDDAVPGDGVCETAPGNGTCTLTAAVQEGNALGHAVITLPAVADQPYPTLAATITGHLTLRGADLDHTPVSEITEGEIVIAAGGTLILDRIGFGLSTDIQVEGTLVAIGSGFSTQFGGIQVASSGTAVLVNTLVWHIEAEVPLITNHGEVVLRHATLVGYDGTVPMIVTAPGASTRLEATTLQHEGPIDAICAGAAPVSGGYNFSTDDTCGLTAVGDQPNADGSGNPHNPEPGSSRLDAVPVGTLGCGDGGLDILGRSRSFDGDGDGIAQCDIGAWEWHPDVP